MLGQLLGDFATRDALKGHADEIKRGVRGHRALDEFTDSHPSFISGCKILEEGCYRYAPVVMDIVLDFYLARNWTQLSDRAGFHDYLNELYDTIGLYEHELPLRMRKPAQRMRDSDWFSTFGTLDGLGKVFYYMSKRVSRPVWIMGSLPCIKKNLEELEIVSLEILKDPALGKFTSSLF